MSTIVNDEILVKIGPMGGVWNGNGGMMEWDEPNFGSVRQILVSYGDYSINSIQTVYDLNGKLALPHRRGGDGNNFDCVTFESRESLTVIRGHYGQIHAEGPVVVRSLRFSTTMSNYGPFGREQGTPFYFNIGTGLDFAGFHGRSTDSHLCALGVYVKNSTVKHYFQTYPVGRIVAPELCSVTPEPCSVTEVPRKAGYGDEAPRKAIYGGDAPLPPSYCLHHG